MVFDHGFAKVHLANRKQRTGKNTSRVANVIFKEMRVFLRCPPLEIRSEKFIFLLNNIVFGFTPLRYHFIRESLRWYPKFSMAHPESSLIPIWQDLMQRQSNSGKFFNNIFSYVGQIYGVALSLFPWNFNTVPCKDFLNCLFS